MFGGSGVADEARIARAERQFDMSQVLTHDDAAYLKAAGQQLAFRKLEEDAPLTPELMTEVKLNLMREQMKERLGVAHPSLRKDTIPPVGVRIARGEHGVAVGQEQIGLRTPSGVVMGARGAGGAGVRRRTAQGVFAAPKYPTPVSVATRAPRQPTQTQSFRYPAPYYLPQSGPKGRF